MLIVALTSWLLLAVTPQDDRFVVLGRRSDEIYVLPLSSINDRNGNKVLKVVQLYAVEDESESRQDSELEVDCAHQQIRPLHLVKYWYFRGAEKPGEDALRPEEEQWQQLDTRFPVWAAVDAIVCKQIDVTPYVQHDLQNSLSRLRAGLEY
jgi:hypothetical protein